MLSLWECVHFDTKSVEPYIMDESIVAPSLANLMSARIDVGRSNIERSNDDKLFFFKSILSVHVCAIHLYPFKNGAPCVNWHPRSICWFLLHHVRARLSSRTRANCSPSPPPRRLFKNWIVTSLSNTFKYIYLISAQPVYRERSLLSRGICGRGSRSIFGVSG